MQNETAVKLNGQSVLLRKGMIKDKLGQILLVLFGALIRDMENNTYYKFKNLTLQKCMNECLPKSTRTSTDLAIQNPGIEAPKDEAAESEGTKM